MRFSSAPIVMLAAGFSLLLLSLDAEPDEPVIIVQHSIEDAVPDRQMTRDVSRMERRHKATAKTLEERRERERLEAEHAAQAAAEEAARLAAAEEEARLAHEREHELQRQKEEEQARIQELESPAVPEGSVWHRLAQCESGGNWSANTGNGYYGGLQFLPSTWRSVGGEGLPHQHSPAEQIKRGKILQERSGWGQWPACSRKIGVR